jgi:hypothetical protein
MEITELVIQLLYSYEWVKREKGTVVPFHTKKALWFYSLTSTLDGGE